MFFLSASMDDAPSPLSLPSKPNKLWRDSVRGWELRRGGLELNWELGHRFIDIESLDGSDQPLFPFPR